MPRVAPAVSMDRTTQAKLRQLVRSPSTRQGLVQRCRIVLAAVAGKSNQQIADELEMPEVTVGKWRRCFANKGLEGLQDAPRAGRPVKYGQEVMLRVQTRACQQPSTTAAGVYERSPRTCGCRAAPCTRSWLLRIYSLIGFAPLRSARILILKPICWTLS